MEKTLLTLLLFLMLLPVTGSVLAQSVEFQKCGSGKRITCVVDGDTIWFRGEKIRLKGYDTPEPTTNICGGQLERDFAAAATERLIRLLNENKFTIVRDGKDKYGRTLAVIRINGTSVGDILIAEKLARRWPDGEEFWCEQ